MSGRLRWGIVGTGAIAKTFAAGLKASETGDLVAVASRELAKAQEFIGVNGAGAARGYGGYESLLADAGVDAVYISTPHPQHAEWVIKAARAKKHILCEKPIGVNYAQAMAMIEAARENDIFLMEAFMYRCHPQTAKIVELVRSGVIGRVGLIQASFGFSIPYNEESRLLKNSLAGGGILDVGCYPTSMARLIAGAAMGRDFADPVEVKGVGHLGKTGVDEVAAAVMKFGSGQDGGEILATLATGVQLEEENAVRVFGTLGNIFVPGPWIPAREGGEVEIHVNRAGRDKEVIRVATTKHLYGIEADFVAEGVERMKMAVQPVGLLRGQARPPAMTWDDSLGNMKALDAWRDSIGLVYEQEKPANIGTVTGEPLQVREGHLMPYGEVAGVGMKVSRLVMGVDNVTSGPHCAVMFDDFFERGGNAFDTAHIYSGGLAEGALGDWIKSRNIRDRVFVLDKGAHTPFCTPDWLSRQHRESLERLGTGVDLYMMHRDNTEVPVGEFVDVLNGHLNNGTMKAIGASNWSLSRVREFNAYAAKTGKVGFCAVSNNFSLANMVDAPWPGCVASSTEEWRAFHENSGMPLFAWSSQARGFFVGGRAAVGNTSDSELVRCWYSAENFERLARAKDLAKRKGVEAIHIALAYVLGQAFTTFALIGPRTLAELHSSLRALTTPLTRDEVRWLEGRS